MSVEALELDRDAAVSSEPSHAVADRVARIGRLLCVGAAAAGALGVLGWIFALTTLTTTVRGQAPMMPNTAIGLLLAGLAGVLRYRETAHRASRAIAAAAAVGVLLLGVGTLAEYVLTTDLRLDQLFFEARVGPYPGRPSPPSALAMLLLGCSLLLFDMRPSARARPSEWLLIAAGTTALVAIVGYAFGAGAPDRLASAPVIGVAPAAAVAVLALATGLLLERPRAGIMAVALSRGPAGTLVRRLAVPSIVAPTMLALLLSWVFAGRAARDLPLLVASLVVTLSVIGPLLVTVAAIPIDQAHQALERSREHHRSLIEQASDGIFVADTDGRYVEVNSAGCAMLGYALDELIGKTIVELLDPKDVPRLARAKDELLAGGTHIAEWELRRKDGTFLPVEVSAKILPGGRWQGIVRDITDRRHAQQELRHALERHDLALRGGSLATWDWNIETGRVVFNARWAEMRGFRLDEVRAHVDSWTSGIHPDDRAHVKDVLARYFDGRLPEYETEHRVATKAGGWIWILDRGRVFERDVAGRPVRMAGTELDVTERKRLQGAVEASEAKLAGIVSLSADAIISVDEHQRITMFNPSAERIFGYSRDELVGEPLELLLPLSARAAHRELVETFGSHSVAGRMGGAIAAVSLRRKSGEEFPAEAAISRLEVGGEKVVTVTLRDITEQRRVEERQQLLADAGAVIASSLDYEKTLRDVARLALESMDICIVDVVSESGVGRRLDVLGRDPATAQACAALKALPVDLADPDPFACALKTRSSALVATISSEMLTSLVRRDARLSTLGSLEHGSFATAPLVIRDKLLGAITFISAPSSRRYDLEDLRLVEDLALRAALAIENGRLYEEAWRAVRARDEVLGVVAHDLRSPLGTISLQAALLRRQAGSEKPAEVLERAAQRMNRLIEDLLDVSRIEAGCLGMKPARLAAAEIVRDAIEEQRAPASAAGVELHVDLASTVPDLWADRDRMHQIFENLIGNAMKFTAAGGRIAVGAQPRGEEVLLWVSDTGAGISEEHLPHLFDRFWQAERASRRGAGLGLPIAKGIVEAHGGHIWAQSTLGRGTTIFFTIPTAAQAEARQHTT